jgi:hypothetical protein
VTFSVVFFMELGSRRGHLAGATPHPHVQEMMPIARNRTMEAWESLKPGQSLRHDRATQCCAAFKQLRDAASIKRLPLPPRSPWLQACAACWKPAVQTAGRARMILCGARALRHVLSAYVAPLHAERPQQGTGTVVLVPPAQEEPDAVAPVACRERLGGLLPYYQRPAAGIF